MLHLRASSVDDTHAIAACVSTLARTGDLIVLAGEMGSGKTAFAQGFGAALGVTEPMTSPTFTLVHSYDLGRITLHHADIYRLVTRNELDDLALNELLEYDGIVLLEWGDVVAQSLGEHLLVRLQPGADDEAVRVLTISGNGKRWAARWERLEAAVAKFAIAAD
ncbi:tRNA (adenosine(37)-N6)-threonylcarbamoyltransferase complex ATPase subunit type 1 TsaE [soil metagenome]